MCATRRRTRRDRIRFNKIRRMYNDIMRSLLPGDLHMRMPRYDTLHTSGVITAVWRGYTRCACGKRRQTIRLE